MANWQNSPPLNYSATLLNQAGTQLYDSGKNTTAQGTQAFQAPLQYYQSLLSGDTSQLMSSLEPQIDPITSQFSNIRKMISEQPRSGGSASVAAEAPVAQLQAISNLIGQARSGAAQGATSIAGQLSSSGEAQTGQGLSATEGAGNIALGGRQQDISTSWKSFFQNILGQAAQGAAKGLASKL